MIDFKKYTLLETETTRTALRLINQLAIPNMAIFIVNESNQLVGSLTDGDIRRGLLEGNSIDDSIKLFMNPSSKFFYENANNFAQVVQYKKDGIRFIPIVNGQKEIVKLLDLDAIKSLIPVDAVLMAGGKGERLKPLTDSIPKPLLKVGDTPIIFRNIKRLASFGVSNFHVSVRHMASQIMDAINDADFGNTTIDFIQEDQPLGTIGSLTLVPKVMNDVVLLMNSDLLTNIDFEDFYQNFIDSNADMQVATVPYKVDIPYAVMNINESGEVKGFKEKPRFTYYSNAGIYMFKKELIELIPKEEKFDATHFMEAIIANNKKLVSYPILTYWLDIGRPEDFYKAQEDVKSTRF